jgi:hypothetical protein
VCFIQTAFAHLSAALIRVKETRVIAELAVCVEIQFVPHRGCKCAFIMQTVYALYRSNFFLFNNQPGTLIIQIYSVIKLYMFRGSSLPIIKSFSTVHSALVSFMQDWLPLPSRVRMFHRDSAWKRSSNLHETYQCRMFSRKTPDDGQRRSPKHVEFYNRINLNN